MRQSSEPVPDPPLRARSLDQLSQACQAQIDQFQRTRNRQGDSSSCDEILRRAAQGDSAALETLLALSLPLIRRQCPPDLRQRMDDVQQLVAERLIRKFHNRESPYRAGSFAEYRTYLNCTITSVCRNMQERERSAESLEMLYATSGFEPAHPDSTEEVIRHLLFARCETLLPDDRHREIFRRRIVRREDVATIVRDLQAVAPDMTTSDVYRIAEHCLVILKNLPEVRAMFESDGGNT